MNKKKLSTRPIAWNGLFLKVPMEWEIDSLDFDHLIISNNGAPSLEVKWSEAPERFRLETYLKKFIEKSQKSLQIKIHELPTPDSFEHPTATYEFFFFSWESTSSNGNGALIFCCLCKRLTLIRFFSASPIIKESVPERILTSFTDHPAADEINWQIFGFNFSTPGNFILTDYSFKPGCYSLCLAHGKTIQTVFSWGPASFLLSKMSLAEFAKQRLPQLKGLAVAGTCGRGNFLEWTFRVDRFKNAGILPFMARFASFAIFRICHDVMNNRVFGILVDSPKEFKPHLIQRSMLGDT